MLNRLFRVVFIIHTFQQTNTIMHSSKQNKSRTAKISLNVKPCIFSNQILQQLSQKIIMAEKSSYKNKAKTGLKSVLHSKKASKNKLPTKPKQTNKQVGNRPNIPSNNSKRQNQKNLAQAVKNSQTYRALVREYLKSGSEQFRMRKQIRKQIQGLDHQIWVNQQKSQEILRIMNNLKAQTTSLFAVFNELRLRNYELKCELCNRGNYQQSFYYDTVPYVDEDQLNYEGMLALQEEIGRVQVGYPSAIIDKMRSQKYRHGESQDKCCICYAQFQADDDVVRTDCKHVHHHDCLKKWLKIKRVCPLCRNQIILL